MNINWEQVAAFISAVSAVSIAIYKGITIGMRHLAETLVTDKNKHAEYEHRLIALEDAHDKTEQSLERIEEKMTTSFGKLNDGINKIWETIAQKK